MPFRIPTPLLNPNPNPNPARPHFFGKRSIPRVGFAPGAAQIHGNRATAPDIDQRGTHGTTCARSGRGRVHRVFHALVCQGALEFVGPALGWRSLAPRNGSGRHSIQLRIGTDGCRGKQYGAHPVSEDNQRSSPYENTPARSSIRLYGGTKHEHRLETPLVTVRPFQRRKFRVFVKPLSGSSERQLKRTIRLTEEEPIFGDSLPSCI